MMLQRCSPKGALGDSPIIVRVQHEIEWTPFTAPIWPVSQGSFWRNEHLPSARLQSRPDVTIRRLADLLCVDYEYLRLRTFAAQPLSLARIGATANGWTSC